MAYCYLSGGGYGNLTTPLYLVMMKLIVAFMEMVAEKLIIFIAAYIEVTVKKLMTKKSKTIFTQITCLAYSQAKGHLKFS